MGIQGGEPIFLNERNLRDYIPDLPEVLGLEFEVWDLGVRERVQSHIVEASALSIRP